MSDGRRTGGTAGATPGVDALEALLGDPLDPDNPLRFSRILEADERGEPFLPGEQALDTYGLNAEFVPAAYGGRLTRLDDLVETMRAVYRRDPALGLGYGVSSFLAAVNIWTAGSARQCAEAAGLLLGNGRIAVAYHELDHGNDITGMSFEATEAPEGYLLRGRKEVVANIRRAEAMVLLARTDPRPGGRSHSQLFVDAAALPADRHLPRFPTAGMRGVRLGGIELLGCPVPTDSVLGTPGQGLETALKSFQITRTTVVAMFTGVLDTGLRTTLRHVRGRRLYGRTAADLPLVRSVLAGAYTDLLLCEAFAAVAIRALHLTPAEAGVYAQAVKYFVAKTLMDAMHRLSTVLGAHFYLRDGDSAIFQKLLRDIQPAGFGHAARAICQMAIVQQLPLLARRSWNRGEPAPDDLFRLDGPLPPVPFDRLRVFAGGRERLSSTVTAAPAGAGDAEDADVARLTAHFAGELRALTDTCAGLPPSELTTAAAPRTYALADRYVRVLVAAACLGIRRHNPADPLLGDPRWLQAALTRLAARPGATPRALPDHLERWLFAELTARFESGRSFGLTGRRLPDGR
ncbi:MULTISPECIES: acyl-CoA dehydrogenase [Streptomyces]|uniref:acyl-CoA dehydrogenase n=1 Tax=Streptomyces TaxID=1883 RepID=UPI00163CABF9|nr:MULTISPECIES: acyl-CoA dehydrogenase [Streptomyces]MBC2879820.1 acyl-CoA dehydrogenase [Streptomyces sp. TYQ1024]UBI36112.1 acyl-CoA dehydrogenase [Streptomyces mobaraensis]UKW28707.1 acyl-CoA dehydrogenase [Streptomyces sp. TYQ1024]